MIHLGMVDIWPLDGGLQLHGRSLLNLHQVMQTKQQRFPSPTKTHFFKKKVFLGISKDLKDGLIFHLGFHLWMPNEESLVAKKSRKTCYCNNFAWFLQKLPSLMMMAGPERLHWVHFFFSYGLNAHLAGLLLPPASPAPSFKFTVFYYYASHRCSSLRLILLLYSMSLGQNSASHTEVVF